MNQDDKAKLKAVCEYVAGRLKEKKEIDDDIAEHIADAAEKLQLRKGNIRKAAKEMLLDELERADRRLNEEELDQIRLALGILADTPLGESAVSTASDKPEKTQRRRGRNKQADIEDNDWEASAPTH